MRVLMIEDDSSTAQSMELMLKSEGFNVYTTDLGEEGIDLAKNYDYDAITLDLNLPDVSGVDVLRKMRGAGVATPVLIVSGTSDVSMRVKTLDLGADDYLSKPFHKDELVARLRAVIRRSNGHTGSVIRVGNIAVDVAGKTVSVSGLRIHLTGKEYQMLELLALRRDRTLTKEMFLNHLYGGMDEPELKIIDVFICKLRHKLAGANDGVHHIETVWGRGYRMSDELGDGGSVTTGGSALEETLRRLVRGPSGSQALLTDWPYRADVFRNVMSGAIRSGLVVNSGSPKQALYQITQDGLTRLSKLGAVAA